jgi:hypothetical protein
MKTTQNITATIGAFKIAMDRAFEMGVTPDEFTKMFMSNKNEFNTLVESCKKHIK